MFNLFKKEKENKNDGNHLSLISVAALLIHSAKIDENFTEKEKSIIKNALIEMGADENNLDEKKIVIEALWTIIYSDEQADMYESNLMRRLSGLLYLDAKVVGDIKEKVKSNQ